MELPAADAGSAAQVAGAGRWPGRAVQPRRADRATNRRSFELALAREIDRVARVGEPALLLALE
ncbi:MAG: hypothetical protein U1E95_12845 [Rubrivivax sp.]